MHEHPLNFLQSIPRGVMIRQEVTGILTGGILSAPAGGTVFSITAGHGQIVDNFTRPESPVIKEVVWPAFSNITDTLVTGNATYLSIDSSGSLNQQASALTDDELKDRILIGVIAHANNLIIASAALMIAAYDNGGLAQELFSALGTITIGCVYSGLAGLQMQRASGTLYRRGAHYNLDTKTPNSVDLTAQSPAQFASYCRNASNTVFSNSTVGTTLTVNRYDDGTATAAGIPNGVVNNNQWQAIRLFLSPNGFTLLQYGQTIYNSLVTVQSEVVRETWFQAPITTLTAFRGYLFVRGGATNLNDVNDAFFQPAGKLGDTGTSLVSPVISTVDEASLLLAGMVFQPKPPITHPATAGFRTFTEIQTALDSKLDKSQAGAFFALGGAEEAEVIMGPPGPPGAAGTGGSVGTWVLAFAAAHG